MDETSSQNVVQCPLQIRTFVFFDLETTGLIQGSRMPKITEISLVALSRDSLISKDGSLPRVMHKLTVPLQPMGLIPLTVSQITGLYNDLLEHEKPFDTKAYELLNSFVSRLCPPVCFVAHNGNQFDYPILLSELNRIGKTLSADILCVDSYIAFKTLSLPDSNHIERSVSSKTLKQDLTLFDDGCDAALAAIIDQYTSSTECAEMVPQKDVVAAEKCEMDPMSMQKVNETTPTHQLNNSMNLKPRKSFKRIDGLAVKKRLPFTHSRPVNYKLDTVYQHLVGAPPLNSHSAESDCLSLLTCAKKIGDLFIRWADLNARPLVEYAKKNDNSFNI